MQCIVRSVSKWWCLKLITSTAAFSWPVTSRRVPGGASEWLGLVWDTVHVRVAPALWGGGWSSGSGGRNVAQCWLAVGGLRSRRVVARWARATLSLGTLRTKTKKKVYSSTVQSSILQPSICLWCSTYDLIYHRKKRTCWNMGNLHSWP